MSIFSEYVKYFDDLPDYKSEKKTSISSGNIFESLARTDPAKFDQKKLEAIRESKNIVEDFNKYLIDIISDVYRDVVRAYNSGGTDRERLIRTYMGNTLVLAFMDTVYDFMSEDSIDFVKEGVHNEKERLEFAKKVILEYYCPDSLTPQGVKRLIDLRIKYNNLLADRLTKVLENNYRALEISAGEARAIIEKVKENKYQGFAQAQNIFKNPNLLRKYAFGTNFDFRPFGGAALFMSNDISTYFSTSPSKRLNLIFEYDAIVVAHGGYIKVSDVTSSNDTISKGYAVIKEDNKRLMRYFKNYSTTIPDKKYVCKAVIGLLSRMMAFTTKFTDIDIQQIKNDAFILEARLKNIYPDDNDKEFYENVHQVSDNCYKMIANFKAKKNRKLFIKNGSSVDWSCQAVSTLRSKNLTNVIDIIRALKSEGFKNVYIGNCNPGDVRLPKDIEEDKDFCVTIGHHSVYMESIEMNNDIWNDVINESRIIDSLKSFFGNFKRHTMSIFSKIGKFFSDISNKFVRGFASMKEGVDPKQKLEYNVDVNTIAIDDFGRAYLSTVSCPNIDSIEDAIITSNETISKAIKETMNSNAVYMARLGDMEVENPSSIFKDIKLI